MREATSGVQVVYGVIRDRAVAAYATSTAASTGKAEVCVVGGLLCCLLPCQAVLFFCYSLLYFLAWGEDKVSKNKQRWAQGTLVCRGQARVARTGLENDLNPATPNLPNERSSLGMNGAR